MPEGTSPAPGAGLLCIPEGEAGGVDLGALREVALTHQRAGRWAEAAAAFSELFPRAVAARELEALARALYGQARCRRGQRRHEEALELAELCREVSDRNGMAQLAARALNEAALVSHEQGHLDEARSRYQEALARAWLADDALLMAFIYQNLGVIANTRGDLREARMFYLESIAASLRCQDSTSTIMVYNNLGMLASDLHDWMESEVFFDRGIEIAERLGHRQHLPLLYANRAEPLIEEEEFGRALASLEHAEGLAAEMENPLVLATVACYRARLHRRCRDLAEAERYARQALSIAEDAGLELQRAEALEETAEIHWAAARPDEACGAMTDAIRIFSAATAARDAELAAETLARWRGARR